MYLDIFIYLPSIGTPTYHTLTYLPLLHLSAGVFAQAGAEGKKANPSLANVNSRKPRAPSPTGRSECVLIIGVARLRAGHECDGGLPPHGHRPQQQNLQVRLRYDNPHVPAVSSIICLFLCSSIDMHTSKERCTHAQTHSCTQIRRVEFRTALVRLGIELDGERSNDTHTLFHVRDPHRDRH